MAQSEVEILIEQIKRLGKEVDGKPTVKFGVLVRDDKVADLLEALVGTLRKAKREKKITYAGEMLLMGVSDDVDVIVLQ